MILECTARNIRVKQGVTGDIDMAMRQELLSFRETVQNRIEDLQSLQESLEDS